MMNNHEHKWVLFRIDVGDPEPGPDGPYLQATLIDECKCGDRRPTTRLVSKYLIALDPNRTLRFML